MAAPDFSKLTDEQLDAYLRQNAPSNTPSGLGASPPVEQHALAPIPGSSVRDFSNVSDARLEQEIANRNPNMGGLEDASRSAVTGLQRGVASLAGAAGDLPHMGDAAASWLMEKLGGLSPQDLAAYQASLKGNQNEGLFPTSGQLNDLSDKYLGPQHDPQTTGGRYAEAISSMVPASALGPGGLGSKIGLAVGSGAGGELAADISPEAYKPAARVAGQLVGGAIPAGLTVAAEAPGRILTRAIGNADTVPAIALMRDAQQRGVPLTLAEAIQQTTNNGTSMGRMQRVLEGTREGEQAFNPFFSQRPQQVDASVRRLADAIAPATDQPSALGPRAQQAAQGGLDRIRQGFNQQARPHYDALQGQTMPEAEFGQLTLNPSFQAALADIRSHPELNGPIAHLPDNNLSVVNEVVKRLDRNVEASRQTELNPQGDNQLASVRQGARSTAADAAAEASHDWRAARDIVAQGNRDYLDPLKAGPGGAIASTGDVGSQTAALYPKTPLAGAANETTQAMRLMQLGEGQTPGVGADLTRQHLLTALEGATKNLQQGPNQWAGAKYANAIAGSPEQIAALNAGVGAVGGDTGDLNSLLEVLRATGKRQPAGSKTAYNASDLAEFKGVPSSEAIGRIGNPAAWFRGIAEHAANGQYRRNTNRLAEVLMMNPDEAEQFLRRARGR